MELRIWWDGINPDKPWCYEVTYLGQTTLGFAKSLADCWKAADQFICDFAVQDNNLAHNRKGLH